MLDIHTGIYGSCDRDYSKPANLVSNNFFPLMSLDSIGVGRNEEYNFTKTYYKPSITSSVRTKASSTKNILQSLTSEAQITKYPFASNMYYITKGMVMDSLGKILFVLTIKKECLSYYTQDKRDSFNEGYVNFSYDNFILFISSELCCDPLHSVFYRRIQKAYLNFCYEKGMEVRVLPSSVIEKNTFANSLNLRFNSITELDYHLRNEVKYFLNTDEGDCETRSLQINIPPVEIDEPIEIPREYAQMNDLHFVETPSVATSLYGNTYLSGNDSSFSVGTGSLASSSSYINTSIGVDIGMAHTPVTVDRMMAMSMAMDSASRSSAVEPVDDDIIEF
jgi:hypothetical protein